MYQIIYCTCPNAAVAEAIASRLVSDKLAACVNILPGVRSIYQWQGEIESAEEHLLLIKSRTSRYDAIESLIQTLHPYQVPEIVAVAVERGAADYLKWIDSCILPD